jgi:hypothetical protein
MTAVQDQVINTTNNKRYTLKDPDIAKYICGKCRQELETIQHITGTFRALAKGDYTHRHNQAANTVH